MSLGSRIISRGRVSGSSSLALTPREPLLFLYPPWTRSLSTSMGPSHDDGKKANAAQQSSPEISRTFTRRFQQVKATHGTFSRLFKFMRPRVISSEQSYFQAPMPQDRKSRDEIFKSVIRKVVVNAELSHRNRASLTREKQALYRRFLEDGKNWVRDWRVIKEDLIKTTPDHGPWVESTIAIRVPSKSGFLSTVDDLIYDIGDQFDCTVELANPASVEEHLIFTLSGSAYSISKALAKIIKLESLIEVRSLSAQAASVARPQTTGELYPARYVVTQEHSTTSIPSNTPPHLLPKPEIWSAQSLLKYVRSITASSPSHQALKSARPRDYEAPHLEHSTIVIGIIRQLFQVPESKAVISRTACHAAMAYFIRKNRFNFAREIYIHMSTLDIEATPETFNIMLRGAAKHEDLTNFYFLLHLMIKERLEPNGKTWVAFIRALPDPKNKRDIFNMMKRKGLLRKPAVLRAAVVELVPSELEEFLSAGHDHVKFVQHMDKKYGEHWLSPESSNCVFGVLQRLGLISYAFKFLTISESRFVMANDSSIRAMFKSCLKCYDSRAALLEVLKNINSIETILPTEKIFKVLFNLAWTTKSANMAKIVWRYACLYGCTNYMMRLRVRNSLKYASCVRLCRGIGWRITAGPIILGPISFMHPMQRNSVLDGATMLTQIPRNGVSRTRVRWAWNRENRSRKPHLSRFRQFRADEIIRTVKVGYNIWSVDRGKTSAVRKHNYEFLFKYRLNMDLQMSKHFRPSMEPQFGQRVQQALELDIRWEKKDYMGRQSITLLAANGIPITVQMKDAGNKSLVWR